MQNQELVLFQSAVKFVKNDFIAIKPCCEFFDIDYKYQVERIKSDFILNQLSGMHRVVAADGKEREMISLPKIGFIRWVYTLNANTVAENLQQKLMLLVTHIHDYLFVQPDKKLNSVQEKQNLLYSKREQIDAADAEVRIKKKEWMDVKLMKKKLETEFWEMFNSDAAQLKLPFQY